MEKNEIVKMILVGLVSALFGAVLVSCYFLFRASQGEGDGGIPLGPILDEVTCPGDAKLCPDGSSVGRVGPNCEFAPCPGEGSVPPGKGIPKTPSLCVDRCGDGICQEVVCMGTGCPCAEDVATCPSDCPSSVEQDFPKTMCPRDAKLCPDGSAVGRIGPNCEFAPCS